MEPALVTAVDSSVLLDVLTDDPAFGRESLRRLRGARGAGALVICPIVWAEVRGSFEDAGRMDAAFAEAGIGFDPFDQKCAEIAGTSWRAYRRGGGTRTRPVADFLIGAHAQVRGGRLLTRDRGFFRRYFEAVELVG
ncbi:MAG: type II toxin-antitoxin system VapC family toxin [Vulcanimicrobiaceae bacterium]